MFRTDLVLKADSKPGRWIVAEPLVWSTSKCLCAAPANCPKCACVTVIVPAGTFTDLASVPALLQNPPLLRFFVNLNPTGRSRRPAVLHDFLYSSRGHFLCGRVASRNEADGLLRAAIRAERGGRVAAFIFWAGVRVGGWAAFRNHRHR